MIKNRTLDIRLNDITIFAVQISSSSFLDKNKGLNYKSESQWRDSTQTCQISPSTFGTYSVEKATNLNQYFQGLFHPARRVRECYWRIYNNLYLGAQVNIFILIFFWKRNITRARNILAFDLDLFVTHAVNFHKFYFRMRWFLHFPVFQMTKRINMFAMN